MRINNNIIALNNHRNVTMNNLNTGKNMEKLASGLRINRAGDDAAGLSISEVMRGQIRGLEQAQRNTQDGISLVQTAEGAMNEVSAMLVRMKELNVQKENGAYSDEDIANINSELDELGAQIADILINTEFNGKSIIQEDPTDTDAANSIDIQIGDSDGRTITIDLIDANFTGEDEDGDDLAVNLASETAAERLSSASNLNTINSAITHVATERGTLGAMQNRLEYTSNNLGTTIENLQAAESRIRDTDMAKEMVELTKNNILLQASQAMLAQANQNPQGVLTLLR